MLALVAGPCASLGPMDHPIDPRVEIGYVHLEVSDLKSAIDFYSGVLGFVVTQRIAESAAFLSAGNSHYHIRLTASESIDAADRPLPARAVYHFSIRYPDRVSLGNALRRLLDAKVAIEAANDHGISEAIYVRDPEGNRLELYRDRPRPDWPRARDGSLQVVSRRLDVDALLADAASAGVATQGEGTNHVTAAPGMSQHTRTALGELRGRLLSLHKVLLDDARVAYEMDRGRIGSNANLLQLVINDPWFAWLHSLSELVVRIDETIAPESPATEADGATLVDQVERLLTASEEGEGFARRYYEALQRQPAVVIAHSDVRRTLKALR